MAAHETEPGPDAEPPGSALRRVVEHLLPVTGAARAARNVVTEACMLWDVEHFLAPATVIISELVANVIDHAHTIMTLQVALYPGILYLAVEDGSTAVPVLGRPTTPADAHRRGRGLQIVKAASSSWGYRVGQGGKTVWARMDLDDPGFWPRGTPTDQS